MSISEIAPQPYPTIIRLPEQCDCIINTVTWLREFEQQGILAAITAMVIRILVDLVLFLSIIGWPLLIALGSEDRRQGDTPKAQAAFEQNRTNFAQKILTHEDIFDRVYLFSNSRDLQAFALASRSFYTGMHTNTWITRQKNYFAQQGFTIVSPETSLNQHLIAYKYLKAKWHFSPAMIEVLGGIMKVHGLPFVNLAIERLSTHWPCPDNSIIKIRDGADFCIAFRVKWDSDNRNNFVEIYRVSNQGSINGLLSYQSVLGSKWAELSPKLFLERLERVMKKESVGFINSMLILTHEHLEFLMANGRIPLRQENRLVEPLDESVEFEDNSHDMRLI